MTLRPFGNRVLLRLDASESTTASGLVIPDQAKQKPRTGVVEAVGDGIYRPVTVGDLTSHSLFTIEDQGVKVGDRLLLNNAFAGAESGEEGVILVDLAEVLAVIE